MASSASSVATSPSTCSSAQRASGLWGPNSCWKASTIRKCVSSRSGGRRRTTWRVSSSVSQSCIGRERTAHAPVGVALDRQAERPGLVPQRTRGPLLEQLLIQKLRDVVADAAHAARLGPAERRGGQTGGRGGVPQRLGADGRLGGIALVADHAARRAIEHLVAEDPVAGGRSRRSPAWCDRATSRWGTPGAAPPRRRRAPRGHGGWAASREASWNSAAENPSMLITTTADFTLTLPGWAAASARRERGRRPAGRRAPSCLPLARSRSEARRRGRAPGA